MNIEQKRYLYRAFLMNKYPDSYQESWLSNESTIRLLAMAIDNIEEYFPEFLGKLNQKPPQFGTFFFLLNRALTFNGNNPPQSTGYNKGGLKIALEHSKKQLEDLNLPDANYTARVTTNPNLQNFTIKFLDSEQREIELSLADLKASAETTLKKILKEYIPEVKISDLAKIISDLEEKIEKEKKNLEKLEFEGKPANNSSLKNWEKNLNLLKDVNKIINLSAITIPDEEGHLSNYCILEDSAGGVTEKYSLIKMDIVAQQLVNLHLNSELNAETYFRNRDAFKLNTQGILKLAKHGKTIEVQREAIALNISRILGFRTTQSTMVEHAGKAALNIPFDRIQLLNDFARGEIHHVRLPSSLKGIFKIGEEYFHYSTVIPVGNQLNSDQYLKDFGDIIAFSYLCNDPDFIGMNNQNKAIVNGHSLYIFDQVLMPNEKLLFDTRLSLVPTGMGRHSRHNKGRNRTLIEDSSFDEKFNSIINLLNHRRDINSMLDNIFYSHLSKITELQKAIIRIDATPAELRSSEDEDRLAALEEQLAEVEAFKKDVSDIKKTINTRMYTLFANFPSLNSRVMSPALFIENAELIKNSLILEKLVNKPVLFTDDGRPYKNPWTHRNDTKITSLNVKEGKVSIQFTKMDPVQISYILNSTQIQPGVCSLKGNTLVIPLSELAKIKENSLFPEYRPFNLTTDYLDIEKLKQNLSAYGKESANFLINSLQSYKTNLKRASNPTEIVELMKEMLHFLQSPAQKGNKGLLKHAQLNLQMDIQKQLRTRILAAEETKPPQEKQKGLADKLEKAFEAAVKLDRVNDFNHVLMAYTATHFKYMQHLDKYLDKCIAHAKNAADYNQAKVESQAMYSESIKVHNKIYKLDETSVLQMMEGLKGQDDSSPSQPASGVDWGEIDVLEAQKIKKEEEKRELEKASENSVKSDEKPVAGPATDSSTKIAVK